jgi:hypothetical protein
MAVLLKRGVSTELFIASDRQEPERALGPNGASLDYRGIIPLSMG